MSRPITVTPHAGGKRSTPHTPTAPTPEREHASKQAVARGGGTTLSHHPKQARQHQKRKHQKANTPVAQTPNPNHPPGEQTRPQQASARYAPKRTQASVPTPTRVGTPSVSAETRVPSRGDRHEAKQAKPPQGRARRTSAHKASAQTTWFAPKRCRPAPAQQGVRRERKAAHNSPRQSAWVVVFVGVFADVCRLFWLVGFGGLGVFWGCLACFLVF